MENESGFEKELDGQAAEKGGPEKMIISKSWYVNWDDWKIWPWNWGKNK